MQKQPPQKFCKKAVLKNFAIFTGKHVGWRPFLIQNIAKFFRVPILKSIPEKWDPGRGTWDPKIFKWDPGSVTPEVRRS